MKTWQCECSAPLFFANTHCLGCGRETAYDPASERMVRVLDGETHRFCANGRLHHVCNWLTDEANELCVACRTNRTIPDLSVPVHVALWQQMESAKRRAFHWLLQRGLPVQPFNVDEAAGLAFDFLAPAPDSPVVTGHENGVITLNLEEANDAVREKNRQQLGEPYRTLLGHFRHELAHHYWNLWFGENPQRPEWLDALREVFGDDRTDYQAAKDGYYANGAPPDWQQHFISAYASMHPWEDWAETWAHYHLITDTLETAEQMGLHRVDIPDTSAAGEPDAPLPAPFDQADGSFARIAWDWLNLAPALNEISLSLGHRDAWPFVLAPAVLRKMHLIHAMVSSCSGSTPPRADERRQNVLPQRRTEAEEPQGAEMQALAV